MLKKIIIAVVLGISLLGCDSDFKQGSCDEGYFEQANFEGGTHCVPITNEDGIENILKVENLNESDKD